MSKKKFKFESPPIIIGDRAMELYKIIPATQETSDLLFLLVSPSDYTGLLEYYGSSEEKKAWYTCMHDEKGVYYYLHWYNYSYENVLPTSIKIKGKLVVDRQTMLMMSLLPAFDRKNKIIRNLAKKYIADTTTIANTFIN